VDLSSHLDQVLQMGPAKVSPTLHAQRRSPGQKVSQIDKLAVSLVFDIDHAPPVFSPAYRLAINNDCSLRPNHSEWEHFLQEVSLAADSQKKINVL
jgi:hypothetical protein